MTEEEWFKMMMFLTSIGTSTAESRVIIKLWDISGQLICKHYQGKKDIFIIYPN